MGVPARPLTTFDVAAVRRDFPLLGRSVHGKPLVYLDSAATSQKPQAVLDRLTTYYAEENANVRRGVHWLSERATSSYEGARADVARFLGARDAREVVFVRGVTEAINLVAQTFGRERVRRGDEIVISEMEHHSNIVPWQMLCHERGARLRVIPVTEAGELDLDAFDRLLNDRTRLVAVVHVSNALGTINPVDEIIGRAHARGIPALIDGAQAVSHLRVDVRALDCDFYTFSGHKLFGPTGIGVVYGKLHLLDEMPPYQGGGEMIRSVSFERTVYDEPPHRFEAGTPNIAGAVGLAAAIEYLNEIGFAAAALHEESLLAYAADVLAEVEGLRLIGTARNNAGILSFALDRVHPHDIGTILDRAGIAIRTGHHCCQPLMHRLGIVGTARASLAFYNTRAEIEALAAALSDVRRVLS
jgi:cysteine desulfurase/selenocysteine lyase